MAKSSLALFAAVGVGAAGLFYHYADPPYDEWDTFAHGLGPRAVTAPPDITLPETDAGTPFDERPFDVPADRRMTKDALVARAVQAEWPMNYAWMTTTIAVSKTTIRVPLADLTLPTEDDRFVEPLTNSLEWAGERFGELVPLTVDDPFAFRSVILLVDRDVPYRLLAKVARAARDANFQVRYAAREGTKLVGLTLQYGDTWPPAFGVELTNDGFRVTAQGMPVETIDKVRNAYDYAALTDFANRWKAADRQHVPEKNALVTASPDVRYEDLLRAEAALRETDGYELFPLVSWGFDPKRASELDWLLLAPLSQP